MRIIGHDRWSQDNSKRTGTTQATNASTAASNQAGGGGRGNGPPGIGGGGPGPPGLPGPPGQPGAPPAQHVPQGPPAFALTPATVNPAVPLDYSTSVGVKVWKEGVHALDTKYNGT
jgi:hypothetical protein